MGVGNDAAVGCVAGADCNTDSSGKKGGWAGTVGDGVISPGGAKTADVVVVAPIAMSAEE